MRYRLTAGPPKVLPLLNVVLAGGFTQALPVALAGLHLSGFVHTRLRLAVDDACIVLK